MLRIILIVFTGLFVLNQASAQKTFENKKRKSDFFGKQKQPKDKNKDDKVRPFGLQVQIGPTYSFAKPDSKNETIQAGSDSVGNYQYTHDPKGRVGVFGEIGFVHFNMNSANYSFGRIYDYIDYGVGVKILGARESTLLEKVTPGGTLLESARGEGKTMNGNVFVRFGIHKLQYLNKTKNIFLDHSLGLNGDFRVFGGSIAYSSPVIGSTQQFSKEFTMNLHYSIGFGIRLAKGKYLVPGIQLPLLGFFDGYGVTPRYHWFSSQYYPVLFSIKYIHLFPAKKNGTCWTGDPADRKRNEQYMQSQ